MRSHVGAARPLKLMLLSGFPWQDWSDPTNPEQWVYHYTTRDAAIGSILPTGQIRLSLFEWMSDPRESKKWLFGGRGAGEHNLLELSDRTNEVAKAHTKILCVSKDTETSWLRRRFTPIG
jgi:hypothetical protein